MRIIGNILIDNNRFDGSYRVEGNWEELFEFYKDYLGDNLNGRNQDPSAESARLDGMVNDGLMDISINQQEQFVNVRVHYRFPQE